MEKDIDKAISFWKQAAANGYPGALNNLGSCYEQGEYLPRDYTKAAQYYMAAAAKGVAFFHVDSVVCVGGYCGCVCCSVTVSVAILVDVAVFVATAAVNKSAFVDAIAASAVDAVLLLLLLLLPSLFPLPLLLLFPLLLVLLFPLLVLSLLLLSF